MEKNVQNLHFSFARIFIFKENNQFRSQQPQKAAKRNGSFFGLKNELMDDALERKFNFL